MEKGTSVIETEYSARTPRGAGVLAALRVFRDRGKTGARSVPLIAALTLLCLGLFAVPAFAEQKRIFSGSFGGEGSVVKNPYPLSSEASNGTALWSLAVDESNGDVYVADGGNYRVEKFSAAGKFLLMFGKAVNKTKVEALASEAEQNVCTEAEVELGAECQAGTAASTPGAFAEVIMYLVVDNSNGPSAGDVYAADSQEGFVTKFNQGGELVESWGDNGSGESPNGQLARPKGEPNEGFGFINGIAGDAGGNLWIDGTSSSGYQRLFEFKQDGSLITDWSPSIQQPPESPTLVGISIDAEDNLYLPMAGGQAVYYKFSPAGAFIGRVNHSLQGELQGAIDSNDNFYINDEGTILVYPSCHPRNVVNGQCVSDESFGSNHPANGALAVDSASPGDTLYAVDRAGGQVFSFSRVTVPAAVTGRPSDATLASATLNGSVNPSGVPLTECFFEFGESESYGQKVACEGSVGQIGSGQTGVPVHASATGLQVGKTYHYRLVAINANNVNEPSVGGDVAFGPPLVLSESSLDVSATSAIAQAEVSPENVDAHARVEYGFDTSYGLSSADTDVGDAEQGVSVPLQGLSPEGIYHYRFVVENVFGVVDGPDRTFTTGGTGEFALPDGRQWQMVSPPSKEGALIEPIGEQGVIQAASNGNAISYTTNAPTEANPAGYVYRQQVLSTRTGVGASSVWSSRDITPPHETSTGIGFGGQEYRVFSEDLSTGIVHPYWSLDPAVSEEASEATPFLHRNFSDDPSRPCTSECFRPLVSGCPEEGEACAPSVEEHADVAAGTVFAECVGGALCGPEFESATPDLEHVVLGSNLPLKHGAPTNADYEWSSEGPGGEERLQLVSIQPDGKASGGSLGLDAVERHPISVDGSRIFWTGEGLYMRDAVKKETVQLDAPEKGCGACASGTSFQFQFASSDGSSAFFTDDGHLTQDAGTGQGSDLYECAIVEAPDGTLECKLSDLTPQGAGGEDASVEGFALGASEDGSRLYFAADGVLGDSVEHGAVSGHCSITASALSTCNLYTLHYNGSEWERPVFIAALAKADFADWGGGALLNHSTARVSPDGRYLAFMSQRSLTGYDNRDGSSGRPDEEVYVYDAQTGRLACASCDPTGARPHGVEYSEIDEGIAGGEQVWDLTQWLAADLPSWISDGPSQAIYQPRYLSDSGRLFFNSSDALVPKDVNGQEDVYEFEPEGVGDCASGGSSGGEVYVKQIAGAPVGACIGLISSGSSAQESGFLDASENGGDVFLLTAAKLASQDYDKAFDIYDAQECTSESPCATAPAAPASPCDTEASCRAAPTPQPEIFGPSGSATFSGHGNPLAPAISPPAVKPKTAARLRAEKLAKALKNCRKGHSSKGKRAVCEKRARKKYGASSARKSSHHRGSN